MEQKKNKGEDKMETVKLQVKVKKELYKELKVNAIQKDVTIGKMLEIILIEYFQKYPYKII